MIFIAEHGTQLSNELGHARVSESQYQGLESPTTSLHYVGESIYIVVKLKKQCLIIVKEKLRKEYRIELPYSCTLMFPIRDLARVLTDGGLFYGLPLKHPGA